MESKVLVIFVVVAALVEVTWGQCHTEFLTARESFDIEKFQGEWFLMAFSPSVKELVAEPEFRCNVQSFYPTDDPAVLNITNQFIRSNGSSWMGGNQVSVDDPSKPALWTVNVNGLTLTVMVLGTDYTSWALLYGCSVFGGIPVELAMVHSRERTLDPVNKAFVDSLVVGLGFPQEFQVPINQTDCDPMVN